MGPSVLFILTSLYRQKEYGIADGVFFCKLEHRYATGGNALNLTA